MWSIFMLHYELMGIRTRRQRALTLSEILISIALLTLMLVTTLVLFAQLLASTTKSGYLNVASVYADRVLEQATSHPNPGPPAFANLSTGEQEFLVQGDQKPTKFLYRLEATEISHAAGGERWLLEVEVRWWTDDLLETSSARAGYGELRTQQSRLVYVKW